MPNEIRSKSKAGRPPGRANVATVALRRTLGELAREHTGEALETILAVMRSGETDAIRLAAAVQLLDRGYGRPAQAVTVKDGRDEEMEDCRRRSQAAVLAILEARHGAIRTGIPDPATDWAKIDGEP